MTKIRIKHIDAFTAKPHTGNPAGVVLDGKGLSDQQMQTIAREMNLSETAFVLPPTRSDADVRLRWFTPTTEVPLCGHATVASFYSLAEEGRMGMTHDGTFKFQTETASGVLPVIVTKGTGAISVMLGMRMPHFESANHLKIELVRVLNVALREFDNELSLLRDQSLFVPMRRLHTLFTMKPNFLLMANFLESRKLDGMCVYTSETIERESVVHSRFFAPNCGINEDPVTGSTHGPLAVLLFQSGMLDPREGVCRFQCEQGDAMGRRGRVSVELVVDGKTPVAVKIGGRAVTVLEGDMVLEE